MTPIPPKGASKGARRRTAVEPRRLHEEALLEEIAAVADKIAAARHVDGGPVARTDAPWRLLCAIERSKYCLSISDLADRKSVV